MKTIGQTSKATAGLIISVILLGSSSVYFASLAFRPNPAPPSLTDQVLQHLQSYPAAAVSSPSSGSSPSLDSITVTGTGVASYTPNEALIQVSVQTENSAAEGATTANAQAVASVIQALEGIGISNSSIQTQGYSLSANYASCYSTCIPQITGYTVTNTLQVNITSTSSAQLGAKAGQVIDTAVKAGANQVNLYFGATSTLLGQLTNGALKGAVASADSQAQAIAGSLGVSITGVISASAGGSYYYPTQYSILNAAPAQIVQTPIMPGSQSYSATVQVVYSIG